jgi:hypothetical protein
VPEAEIMLKGLNESSEIPTVGSQWLRPLRRAIAGDHFLLLESGASSAWPLDLKRHNSLAALRRYLTEILIKQILQRDYARRSIGQGLSAVALTHGW